MDSPDCNCGNGKENINYVLLHCSYYAGHRKETLWEEELRVGDLAKLLGDPEQVRLNTRFLSQDQATPQVPTLFATERIYQSDISDMVIV